MQKTTNTAKFVAGLVGFAFAVALVATPVATKAQSTADLQAMINSLLAQIAALQGQVGGSTSAGHTFTTDLTVGSSGAEVTALQQFLVSKGFLRMPAGVAMGYFGEVTRAALAAFQAANGITPSVGFFGPATRAKVNAMAVVVTPGTPGTPSTPGSLQGGAGDVTVTQRSSGLQDEVLEGDEEVPVLGFEVEADGSDVAVTSVRVEFEHTGSGSDRLDRYVDEVQILVDGDVVGSADVSEFNESNDVYSRNIPVSGVVVGEDDTVRFQVAVTATNNIDSDDLGEDWDVGLGQIRFNDATGAILTDNTGEGVTGDVTETFSFEDLASSGDIELTVNDGDEEINDAHTVQVDDSSDTNDVEVLSFTVEADGSDLFLNGMTFGVTSDNAGVTEIANDFRLMMDGEEVGTVRLDVNQDGDTSDAGDSFASTTDDQVNVVVTDLDDDDVVISEGDEVSFTLLADINDIDGGFGNGASLSVSLDSSDVDAEDENGDNVTDLTGSADSNDIAFSASGIMLSMGGSDTSERIFNLDTTSTDDQGKFVINFDVTAFEDTAYIALTAASSTASTFPTSAGAYVVVENTSNAIVSSGTTTATLERVSGGTLSGNFVKINAGQTAHLALTVYYDAATSGTYRAQLFGVNFADDDVAGTNQQLATPAEDYQSPSEQILN